jgi:hypothetical protein
MKETDNDKSFIMQQENLQIEQAPGFLLLEIEVLIKLERYNKSNLATRRSR